MKEAQLKNNAAVKSRENMNFLSSKNINLYSNTSFTISLKEFFNLF